MMLLERNQAAVGLIAAIALGLGTVGAIVVDRSLIAGGTNVEAVFSDAAGLQAGDSVLIAGIRSGAVEKVEIFGEQAKATLRVTEPMPKDTRAEVVLQNFLGKRAVTLIAGDNWDQPLENGDVIPLERTGTPVDFAEFNQEQARLLNESDAEAFERLITSLADITAGQKEEVDRLLEGLSRITEVVADKKEELAAAIARSEEVFGTLAAADEDIRRIIDAFSTTLDRLVERRGELVTLLEETARSSNLTADLVAEDRQQLDRVLHEIARDLQIVDRHQVDLAHVFAYGGVAYEGYAHIGVSQGQDNPYWANIFAQSVAGLGFDSIAGCEGVIDEFLDTVLGEDPRSCEQQSEGDAGLPTPGGEGALPTAPSSLDGFFRLHIEPGGVR